MYKETLTFNEITTLLKLQNEKFYFTNHFFNGFFYKCIRLSKNKRLYAKQQIRKKSSGNYFLCNEFEYTKGLIMN